VGKRNWEPRLFAAAFILVGLWAALRAFFTPFYRLRSIVGSWDQTWAIATQVPGHWAAAVLVRALIGALLLWLILHLRRRGLAAGYFGLAIAAFAIPVVDVTLWGYFHLG
jgi:hypothetical protein